MSPHLSFHRRRSALTTAVRHNDANNITNIIANQMQAPRASHLTSAIANASYSALHALLQPFQCPSTGQSAALTTTKQTMETIVPALHAATAALDPVSISILLSSDAPPRAKQKDLEPLHVAIRTKLKTRPERHAVTQVIHVLMAAGAVEGHFEDDMYPPNYALIHRNEAAFTAFFTHPSDLSTSLYKHSTIRYACTHPSLRALSTLLPHIDITKPDAYNSTPLHHAVSSPHASEETILSMVELILLSGCPLNTRDIHGRTAFQIAKRRKMQTVVDALLVAGASEETFAEVLLRHAKRDSKKRAAKRIVRSGSKVTPHNGKCSICLEALSLKECVEMSCGHTHHSDCLSNWVRKTPSCPLCKHHLP